MTVELDQKFEERKLNVCSLSVVIPVYNQEKEISHSINNIKSVIEKLHLSYEIIVVNDGSTDNTVNELKNLKSSYPLKIISYPKNVGKGYAVKEGILNSKGEFLIFMDGDLEISSDILHEYIVSLQQTDNDIIIGSKYHEQSIIKIPLRRRILSRIFNLLVRTLLPINLMDTQSGLKAGKGDVLRKVFKIMLTKRYAFDVEMLTVSSLFNCKVGELPIKINLNCGFKKKEMYKMFVDLLAISYRFKIIKWYQRQLKQTS
ncbi:dolichyl-phosphate beta-glucosyltransferase protein [Marine Group I thaumarchaeote SCGC AAA799-B03]|uniref:Dolichyl-phosphate beta-glucosyltransferase protein n=1 Tax=Marine Group I thaumarchaeote SCGC AAA799-B03 TaxID=1502289 RepID=A0A087S929_9ARCH|nr:dolichyl-phosphate beta-glucosyltransferase protein [Marine Group I thaumarchaeote SCGC AAA799-B03]